MGLIKRPTQAPSEHAACQDERSGEGLLTELNDPDADVRRRAARDLVDRPGSSAVLVARLACETTAAVREAILMSLTELADITAVQGLAQCLRSEDVALRNGAIEAMQQLPGALASIMADLLADEDVDVRIFAVNILATLRHPEVESWLLKVITDDPHVNVCAAAVDLLGEVGSARAAVPLAALAGRFSDEPYIRFAAEIALRRLQGERA